MAKALPKIYQGPHELEKSWVNCQGDGKNMLILENGGKVMKDGLATKALSYSSLTSFTLSIEKQEK